MPINALAAEIDEERDIEVGLASAIRVYVLAWYRDGKLPSQSSSAAS